MNKEEFNKELEKLNIVLNKKQQEQLENYAKLLIEYNKHTNITAIKDINGIYLKHFYDSLTIIKIINFNKYENCNLLDIGSGGGFPGIVLKIVFPHLNITLLDSNNKKSEFQKYIIEKLNLESITIVNDRAEKFITTNKDYDIVVARAVSNLNTLSEISIPYVKIGGYFIAMKGNAEEEIKNSLGAITTLGGKIIATEIFNLPHEESIRTLIKIEKINQTPVNYPRNYAQIINKPLK